MEKRLENRLTMYEGVISLFRENADKVNSVPGFSEAGDKLSAIAAEIKVKSLETSKASAGKTSAKHTAEDELVDALLPVCSALYIFARKQKKAELVERMDVTEWGLRKKRDTDLALFGTDAAALAKANAADLVFAGITDAKIDDLTAKAAAYENSIGRRESGVAARIGSREEMKDLFHEVDELLIHEIDRYMEVLKPEEPGFYAKYYAARPVKDTGVRHRKEDPEEIKSAETAGTAKS